jgi:TetR/AcrR family acrAB operon transcriptional repressor
MARRTAEDAARTRDAIIDAALAVFAERGFAASQLEDIARRASVTRGALYHHFSDKAELYLAVLRERWESVMAPLLGELQGSGEPELRLRAFVKAFLAAMDTNPQARALMKMSVSAETLLPELAGGAPEKAQALKGWVEAIRKLLWEARKRSAEERARALIISLVGYATWTSLAGPAERTTRARLVDFFLDGVLS